MEYPHRRYVLFLLSQKMQSYEIAIECQSKGLMPPNDEALKEFSKELGTLPRFWKPSVSTENTEFRRWLRDKGVLKCWVPDETMVQVHQLLMMTTLRKDFEGLMVIHGMVEDARAELSLKYSSRVVPSAEVLERFCDYFWDLGNMTSAGIYDFLAAGTERADFIPAHKRELVVAYGTLGLRQKVEAEEFLSNVVQLANQQTALLLGRAATPNGATAAGVAALMGRGMEALQLRDAYRTKLNPSDMSMRAEATDFKARTERSRGIPTFDQLIAEEVHDAEYTEPEAGNLRRLPVRRE